MIRSAITVLCLFWSVLIINAQSCLPNGFTFTSQAQLEAFASEFSDCTSIDGSIYIKGDDIVSLKAFQNITCIKGSLHIQNNENLTTLDGLQNLTFLGKASEASSLIITHNSGLLNLDGLQGLSKIAGTLDISNNLELQNLNGLNELKFVAKSVYIQSNPNMGDLLGLGALAGVGTDFFIEKNSKLTDLNGLSALNSIGGSFYLQFNPALTDISSLNPNLQIENSLFLSENTQLTDCNVEALCKLFISAPKKVLRCENGTGCGSIEELLEGCRLGLIGEKAMEKRSRHTPNQTEIHDLLNDNTLSQGRFVLFNHAGNSVLRGGLESIFQMEFLPSGFYLLKLYIGKNIQIKRIIKK